MNNVSCYVGNDLIENKISLKKRNFFKKIIKSHSNENNCKSRFNTLNLNKINTKSIIKNCYNNNKSNSSSFKIIQDNGTQLVKNLQIDLPIKMLSSNIDLNKRSRQKIDEDNKVYKHRTGQDLKFPIITNQIEYEYEKHQKLKEEFNISYKNLGFEAQLKSKIQEIKIELSKIKEEKTNYYNKIQELLNKIENNKTKVYIIDNRNKIYKDKKAFKKSQLFFFLKKEYESETKIKQKKQKLIEEINLFEQNIDEFKLKIKDIENKIIDLRKEKNELIDKLVNHYKNILYEGTETRNEGLSWIIREIWNLKRDVPLDFFPTFLDFKSIQFLFELAKKVIELINNKNELENYKKDLYLKYNDKNKKRIFATSLSTNNIQNPLTDINTNLINNLKKNRVKSLNKNSEKLNVNFNKLNYIKDKINDLNNEIKEFKKKEVNRIIHEFIENDYEKRYNVIIDVVLSALLGDNNKENEIKRYLKAKKEYKNKIINLRFFDSFNHKS